MDRQDVEYIQREDTDEFDEFGRKKKRKQLSENIKSEGEHKEERDVILFFNSLVNMISD